MNAQNLPVEKEIESQVGEASSSSDGRIQERQQTANENFDIETAQVVLEEMDRETHRKTQCTRAYTEKLSSVPDDASEWIALSDIVTSSSKIPLETRRWVAGELKKYLIRVLDVMEAIDVTEFKNEDFPEIDPILAKVFEEMKKQAETCSICLDQVYPAAHEASKCGRCAKIFHDPCIERWLLVAETCPNCRYRPGRDPAVPEENVEELIQDNEIEMYEMEEED